MGFGFGFIGKAAAPPPPATITNLTWLNTTVITGGSVLADVTFPATTLGTARATRYVICVLWDIGDNNVPSGASIGGIAATVIYDPTSTAHSPYIFGALVPTNANTDITINYPTTQGGTFALAIYTMDGTPATFSGNFYSGLPASFVGITIAAKTNGGVIAGFQNGKAAGSPSTTWGQGSVALTANFTDTAFTTATYVSGRSKNNYLADATQEFGTLTGGTQTIRAFILAVNP